MRRVTEALAKAPHWQIIETYWNAAIQQNNIWSIAFEAHTQEILKEVAESMAYVGYYKLKLIVGSSTCR
jgi:hypothetical protein